MYKYGSLKWFQQRVKVASKLQLTNSEFLAPDMVVSTTVGRTNSNMIFSRREPSQNKRTGAYTDTEMRNRNVFN